MVEPGRRADVGITAGRITEIGRLAGQAKRTVDAADLVVASYNSVAVSILVGHGDGTFSAPVQYGTGLYPNTVAIADLTGDGKPDIFWHKSTAISV